MIAEEKICKKEAAKGSKDHELGRDDVTAILFNTMQLPCFKNEFGDLLWCMRRRSTDKRLSRPWL